MCSMTDYPRIGAVLVLVLAATVLYTAPMAADTTAISYGSNISGSLNSPGERHYYSFEADSGDVILIRMGTSCGNSNCVAPRLELFSPSSELILWDEDGGSVAELVSVHLDTSGSYTIIDNEGVAIDHPDNVSGDLVN